MAGQGGKPRNDNGRLAALFACVAAIPARLVNKTGQHFDRPAKMMSPAVADGFENLPTRTIQVKGLGALAKLGSQP